MAQRSGISGGYFVVRGVPRPQYAHSLVLPEVIWTPTSCICNLYPADWGFSWCKVAHEQIVQGLAELGLLREDLMPLQQWVDSRFNEARIGFPGNFLDLAAAREFVALFTRKSELLKIIGIGLPEEYVSEFLDEARPGETEAAPGIYRSIELRRELVEGNPLGYEPLGYDYGGFHSFICNSLERDYTNTLGLHLNQFGRFEDLADCAKAVEYTRLESTGAEPALWQPWLIHEHALTDA